MLASAALPSAKADDVDSLRARAQAVADRVTELEVRLKDLQARKEHLSQQIGAAGAEVGILELKLDKTERSLDAARDVVESRAVEIYKSSTTAGDIEVLLTARDMSELELIAEVQSAAAVADRSAIDDLEEVSLRTDGAQEELEEKKSTLISAQAEVDTIENQIEGSLDERQNALTALSDEIEQLQAEALSSALGARRAGYPSNPPAPSGDLATRLEGTGPSDGVRPPFTTTGVTFEGEASWYGPGFEGNPTANGDVYDSRLFTAASKTLPLNTYLYIEYRGRGCVVLVNDRGPYVGNRVLDLSRGTAAAIGMEHAGVGWVSAEIIVRA